MPKIERRGRVRFHGVRATRCVSAIAFLGKRALIVTDETTRAGNLIQVFERDGDEYRAVTRAALKVDEAGTRIEEMDLEGLAIDGRTVYALGSHSAWRAEVVSNAPLRTNRAVLLSAARRAPARDVLLRFTVGSHGDAGPVARSTLRPFLDQTEPFKSFRAIAGKENGIDAEGLAISHGYLYVGFRGPVLRGNYTPVVRCRFGSPIRDPQVLFLALGGRGVRDLCAVEDGILVLAGPVGGGPGSFQLLLWDGRDCVPGTARGSFRSKSRLRLIGDLPMPDPASNKGRPRPEGLAVVKDGKHFWEIIVTFDGLKNGHGTLYRIAKP